MPERVELTLACFLAFIRGLVIPISRCLNTGARVMKSDAIGIEMPRDFPTEAHNTLVRRLSPYQPSNPTVWSELAAGWNAVATRFRSAADADKTFTASISSPHALRSHEELHRQNEALFTFFVNGYAALESFTYAVFSMGALLRPSSFPMDTPAHFRAITPKATQTRFAAHFPNTSIEARLTAMLVDPKFERWGLIRNVLAHRAVPARHHHMRVGSSSLDTTDWEILDGIALNAQTTASERPWLATTLTDSVVATPDFATVNFS
ncbi:MAG TPA: hypothetical protein VGR70_03110 [Stellaceae bacterium]|nr:hypothetical protein [Stellaceae bacterium]